MIERPKRAVTRFFIPLIDVLILLFCIFLLMPFINQPGTAEPTTKQIEDKKDASPEELKREIAGLRLELSKALEDKRKLQEERTNPADKVAPFMLEIDSKTGHLYYFAGGESRRVKEQRDAQEVINQHKRRVGIGKDPLFIIMLPRQFPSAYNALQEREYKLWFKDVPHQFSDPFSRRAIEEAAMYSALPLLAELGSIEKVVITALAVAGGFMVGFVLTNLIARFLCKFVWKKEPPEKIIRFVRFAGGVGAAILVYLLLQGEGGLGLGGKGGGNPSNPNQGKDDNQNNPKQEEPKNDPKKEETKPKDKSTESKAGVLVVYLLRFDSPNQHLYRIGDDPTALTIDEVLKHVDDLTARKEPITRVDIEAASPDYSVQALTFLELKLSQRGIKSTRPTMKEPSPKN